jgi:hypothetical protein
LLDDLKWHGSSYLRMKMRFSGWLDRKQHYFGKMLHRHANHHADKKGARHKHEKKNTMITPTNEP